MTPEEKSTFESDHQTIAAAPDRPWERGGPYPSVSVICCLDPPTGWPDPQPGSYQPVCMVDSRSEGIPSKEAIAVADFIAAASTRWPIAIATALQEHERAEKAEKRVDEKRGLIRDLTTSLENQNAKNAALQQRIAEFTSDLRCFSCDVAYSDEIKDQPCDHAHREHWTHEWVNKRVRDLTAKCAEHMTEREKLQQRIGELEDEKMAAVDELESMHDVAHCNILLEKENAAEHSRAKTLAPENEQLNRHVAEWRETAKQLEATLEKSVEIKESLAEENERLRGLIQTCFRVTTYGHVHENHRSMATDEAIRATLVESPPNPKPSLDEDAIAEIVHEVVDAMPGVPTPGLKNDRGESPPAQRESP